MQKIFIIAVLILSTLSTYGQLYNTTIGVRTGIDHFGLALQQRIAGPVTTEIIVASRAQEDFASILLKFHIERAIPGNNIYLGIGSHFANHFIHGNYKGVEGMVGIEFKLPRFPIVFSLDLQPVYYFDHIENFNLTGGLTVRYIIWQRELF